MKVSFSLIVGLLMAVAIHAADNALALFKADKQSGILPLSVSFRGIGSDENQSYEWDFGNGNTSKLKTPSATFVNPGNYTVKLVVSNGMQRDTSFMNIEVLPNPDLMRMYHPEPQADK